MNEAPFLPNFDLEPRIVRSRRRTLALHIKPDATLEVRVPNYASKATVQDFIRRNMDWILRTQERARKNYRPPVQRSFTEGETFLMLGEPCKLIIVRNSTEPDSERSAAPKRGKTPLEERLRLENGAFLLNEADLPKARKIFEAWYQKQAREIIPQRVAHYNRAAGYRISRIRINSPRHRWGSCSAKGNLNFSWRLVMAPLAALDSVVAHELTHLVEQNHSKKFWDKVALLMPDYKAGRDWLKKNGELLNF